MNNSLENTGDLHQPFRKPKRKPIVSIAIAIICERGIVMASDSRTTNPDHTIRDNAQKITILPTSDGNGAMVAQSGDDDLGSRIVEKIAILTNNKPITDWQSIADVADKIILEEQLNLKKPFLGSGYTDKGFQEILRGFDLSLLMAHYYKDRPYIFTSDFYPGRTTPKKQPFVSIGCGSPLANFLLDSFEVSSMPIQVAIATAIYVIEEVKKFDPRCEGQTKVGFIEYSNSKGTTSSGMYPSTLVESIVEQIQRHNLSTKNENGKRMNALFRAVVEEIIGKPKSDFRD